MSPPLRRTALVTGATGFLGRYVVEAALAAGHHVRAVVRPGAKDHPWSAVAPDRLSVARIDLRQGRLLRDALSDCDTVVHLAAVKGGDFAARFAGTVVATENLLAAMDAAGVGRLVHCSSFSVYRAAALPRHALLDETAPLEDRPLDRDDYAQVKLEQERLVREWGAAGCGELTVLRPGLIYGPGELWHALLGVELLPQVWLGAGTTTRLPMAWVENVADAFVCALGADPLVSGTFNLVDDELPTTGQYVRAVREQGEPTPRLLPLGYPLARLLVKTVEQVDRRLLGARLKLPTGLMPVPFEARFRPLEYSNARARHALGWAPARGFPGTMRRASALSAGAGREP